MKSFYELGYMDVDEAYLENKDTSPHHFHYYSSGMITYKKEYIHLYRRKDDYKSSPNFRNVVSLR